MTLTSNSPVFDSALPAGSTAVVYCEGQVGERTRKTAYRLDVRRPKDTRDLHLFSGRIFEVTCPKIAVLGTDGAIGKRTTATLLVQALNERGINAVMVGTGQTTLIQGGKYGAALDALVPQFISGEVENQVVAA